MANKPSGNQYQPFDALKGFSSKLREIEKSREEVEDKKILSDEKIEELNYKFSQVKKNSYLYIKYYCFDRYKTVDGIVSNIDYVNRYIKISNLKIKFDDIYDIKF